MPALPPPDRPQYGVDALYEFDFYPNQAAYVAKFGSVPDFNINKPVKRWIDPDPKSASRNVTYSRVLAVDEANRAVAGPNGHPLVEAITIDKAFAQVVNIPSDTHTGTDDTGQASYELGCPLRALTADEQIVFAQFNVVVVRRLSLWEAQVEDLSGAFTQKDRELLRKIAVKVGA